MVHFVSVLLGWFEVFWTRISVLDYLSLHLISEAKGTCITLLAVTWPIQRYLFAVNLEFWHLSSKFFKRPMALYCNNKYKPKKVQHSRSFPYQNRHFQSLHHSEPSVWWTVRECKFLISFHWKTCTIGAQDNNILCMGGVFDNLHAKFESRTWSVVETADYFLLLKVLKNPCW